MLKAQLQEAQTRRKAAAREKYVAEITKATPDPDLILEFASAAGIDARQIEKDADLIGRAAELAEAAKALPGLLKRQTAATAKVSRALAEFDRIVPPLQAAIDSAHEEESIVAGLVAQSADAAREEAGLHREYPELVPSLSPGAQHVATCNSKSAERELAQRKLAAATQKVQRIRAKVQHAQAQLRATASGLNREAYPDAQDSPAAAIARQDAENAAADLGAALAEQAVAEQGLNKLEG